MPRLTDGSGDPLLSRVAKRRRAFLRRHLGEKDFSIVEVGALDNPTFLPSEGDIKFADFFTQEESQKRHQNATSHDASRIVPVDYILKSGTISECLTTTPELLIANHLLEHIADPLSWFEDVRKATNLLFLALPDRRYTFDYFKPCSDAADWLQWRAAGLTKPSYFQVLRHLYYHTHFRHEAAWSGEKPTELARRFTLDQAMERAQSLEGTYADVHCSVFTYESFVSLIEAFNETDLLPWTIAAAEDVATGDNEFRVILRAI